MNGSVVFRVKQDANNIPVLTLLKRVCNNMYPFCCDYCKTHTLSGEYDMCDKRNLYCESCSEKSGHVQTFENVFSNHFALASTSIAISVGRGEKFSKSLWFVFGKFCTMPLYNVKVTFKYGVMQHAKHAYLLTRKSAKQSIDVACMCLMRLGFYKDARQLVIKLLWPLEIVAWCDK